MKGQRLLVRDVSSEDRGAVEQLYRADGCEPPTSPDHRASQEELLGKLVGDVVAHLSFAAASDTLHLRRIHVASHLRHKRIGRFMIQELERAARSRGCGRLIVEAPCASAGAFFKHLGFSERDGLLERVLKG